MASMKVLLLICSVGTPQADCAPETALDILTGPDQGGCGMIAQAYLASTALGARMTGQEYLKVVCSSDAERRATVPPRLNQAQNGVTEGQIAASAQPHPRHYTIRQ